MILISGPCVIEDYSILQETLETILDSIRDKNIEFYFKSSFLKDNRTNNNSYEGIGFKGLELLLRLKDEYKVKICTDFHSPQMIDEYHNNIDVIQIPAFLSKQSSLLKKAGSLNKTVHIKRGQFISPLDILESQKKVGHEDVFITERGTFFGYDQWFFDPRNITTIKKNSNTKVLSDITHLTKNSKSRGLENYEESKVVGKSSIVAGADGLFIETRSNPELSKCDSNTMLPLKYFKSYINEFYELYEIYNK